MTKETETTMTLVKRLIALTAAIALMMGTIAGLASTANANTDSAQGSVSISCGIPATVEMNDFAFAPVDLLNSDSTSTDPGAVEISVDMGCYWGPWQVGASATPFTSGSTSQTFSASHLSLEDANVELYSLEPIDFLGVLEPTASDAFFTGGGNGGTVLETAENFFLWWQLPDSPAPFTTTASYTGHLTDLPFIFSSITGNAHVFTSTITVTLTLD
jgi:hypothetical protein